MTEKQTEQQAQMHAATLGDEAAQELALSPKELALTAAVTFCEGKKVSRKDFMLLVGDIYKFLTEEP
jgi:hypothetical protein